jgi:hypothetical protein
MCWSTINSERDMLAAEYNDDDDDKLRVAAGLGRNYGVSKVSKQPVV